MTQFLPQNLLALFSPRDPIPYLPPTEKLPHEKTTCHKYAGVGAFLAEFEDPKDTPPPTRVETKDERKERKRKERAEQIAYKLEQDLAMWDPTNDTTIQGDPFKTLFVARINYDSSESKLLREFEIYGPVKRISMVHNQVNRKPRGYAFIEFEHERDMHSAYKHADGKKTDGRRVLVDVERGRTVKGWRPRRLGGGLGGTRRGGPEMNSKYSGHEENQNCARSRSRSPGGVRGAGGERSHHRHSHSRERGERTRRRSRSRERKRRNSRYRKEDGERDRRRCHSRSKDRKRSRSRDRKRSRRSRSNEHKGRCDILDVDDIKQEKSSGKTPPHEPENGFKIEPGLGDESAYGGHYNAGNGNDAPPQPPPEEQHPAEAYAAQEPTTNEYGSMQ